MTKTCKIGTCPVVLYLKGKKYWLVTDAADDKLDIKSSTAVESVFVNEIDFLETFMHITTSTMCTCTKSTATRLSFSVAVEVKRKKVAWFWEEHDQGRLGDGNRLIL